MSFARVFRIITLLAFLFEVLNPTTTFVREQALPIHSKKTAKIEKADKKDAQLTQQSHQTDDESDVAQDDDYLVCAAVLPVTIFPAQPYAIERSLVFSSQEPPQGFFRPIDRPPSLS